MDLRAAPLRECQSLLVEDELLALSDFFDESEDLLEDESDFDSEVELLDADSLELDELDFEPPRASFL